MASNETYDGTMHTSVNAVVATSQSLEASNASDSSRALDAEDVGGPTGSREGVEGVVISGHEDRYVHFFDVNSGMSCPREHTQTSLFNVKLTLACRTVHLLNARTSLFDC